MEIGLRRVSALVVACFEVVRVRVVDVLRVFVENLEFQEVDALLEEIDVSEMFEVKNELGPCSV